MRCYCCDTQIKGESQEYYDRPTGRYYSRSCWDLIQKTIDSYKELDKSKYLLEEVNE